MEGYSVKILECSGNLSPKQRVLLKDTGSASKIDQMLADGDLIIDPDFYAVLEVNNEKAEDKTYENYIIVDKSGERFVTGSKSFWSSFMDIYTEMSEYPDEEWRIRVFRQESKNYKGKYFITCTIE